MTGQAAGTLAELAALSEPLGWVVVVAFLAAVVLNAVDREYARPAFVVGWIVFAAFWFVLIYPYFVEDNSVIRGVGAALAAPLSLLVAKVLYDGRDSLFVLSRAVALMALMYVPFMLLPALEERLILLVTGQTAWVISALGFEYELVNGVGAVREGIEPGPIANTFAFDYQGTMITFTIILSCTGLGSMAVIAGLVGAVDAPLGRKARALGVALPIIYVLNIARNVFIAISFGYQYMDILPGLTMALFAIQHPMTVSYIWADRIVAQSLSVVALVLIVWLVVHEVPEVLTPIEDVLYLLTGEEYDLAGAMDVGSEGGSA